MEEIVQDVEELPLGFWLGLIASVGLTFEREKEIPSQRVRLGARTTDAEKLAEFDSLAGRTRLISDVSRFRGRGSHLWSVLPWCRGPGGQARVQVVPLALAVERKSPDTKQLRTVRRFTWTTRDGLEQYDKLRTVFEAAAFTENYFCNRALFADHFLVSRLRDDAAWRDNPSEVFQRAKSLLDDAPRRWLDKGEQIVRDELYGPLFDLLGFQAEAQKTAKDARTKPDYVLTAKGGGGKTAAFVYAWDRWLDGPDFNVDQETSEENPGACVVTALEEGVADWIIVTNGRVWRLYSRQAHSRATNFYEVDLIEALVASGDTDPNEAFRYWWLFFRAAAFGPAPLAPAGRGAGGEGAEPRCWLDAVARGSRDYAKRLGERLKDRVFLTIFPHLAEGFLEDRRRRLGTRRRPNEEELRDTYEATLTLLYRLLFLLYAESRDLLPIREAPYHEASLKKIKEGVAERAGIAESEVPARLAKAYSASDTGLYDRVMTLCRAMDNGDPLLNVPIYNGGLFITDPPAEDAESRECHIARFLLDHKVPDRHLALALDRLARDPDEKTLGLVFIDYKSLEVRHLGSIYEGLLEFKLKVAEEDLTTKTEKKREKYIPLGKAKPKRGKTPEAVVRRGEVYLSNDKAERKASGSYYTPDPIVEYIVEHTVGPVLAEKLEALRPEFRKVRKTFDRQLANARDPRIHQLPSPSGRGAGGEGPDRDVRQEAADKTYDAHRKLVDELFDFRVLDPAMGSGHFLVEAVDFITDRVLTFLNQFPVNPVTFMLERMRRNILAALGEQGVAIVPDKLTEVNLLKRHVLKRCTYGVDLNPMAVELAKVSLWLDAFTIGAPLSFLDHHLRCGNSLIGAAWADLENALADRPMLRINKQPLVEAIRQVIETNRLADATAAEVRASAEGYRAARQHLSGYATVFHLLTARHFGHPDAAGLIAEGDSVRLEDRKSFVESLFDDDERALVRDVENLAERPDLRFFHWEIEFPEVFFGFEDANERRINHKDRIAEGTAGFDVVVGNPPYVRMELIKPLKPHLREEYRCHSDRADLFIYFYERAVKLLRHGARNAFIASSNWMKTAAGNRLRDYLGSRTTLLRLLDVSDARVFEEASTYPCVLVIRKGAPGGSHLVLTEVTRDVEDAHLIGQRQRPLVEVPQRSLSSAPWRFQDPRVAALRQKLAMCGGRLVDRFGSPLYGIKTGLNEAFVIDRATRDRLASSNPECEQILKPFLEGKDVKPWRTASRDLWLIYTKKGIDVRKFPAVVEHLKAFRARLEARATRQEWYELQQPQARYAAAFEEPKIVYPRFTNRPVFALDKSGQYVNNALSVLPFDDPVLLFCLMSPITWFFLLTAGAPMANGYRQIHGHVLEAVPIPTLTRQASERIRSWILEAEDICAFEDPPWDVLYDAFELSKGEQELLAKETAPWT